MTGTIERLLRHDRRVVSACLLIVIALAWAWTLSGAGMGMSALEMTRHDGASMAMMAPATWDGAYSVMMFFMWWIMMVAMMLPSAAPVVLLAAAQNRRIRTDVAPYGSSVAFGSGYLLAWGAFSLLATATQWGLEQTGVLSPMLESRSRGLSGTLLLLAGAWQFSPWKRTCLHHCRSPVIWLSEHYRPGHRGAFRMGLAHGLYCLGCCWFLMALLFVGGVMNLLWIVGLALYVWLEKSVPAEHRLYRWLGAALMAWGAWWLLV